MQDLTGGPLARLRGLLPTRRDRSGDPPRVRFTREDARRLNAAFAGLDRADRRAIVRAVNRGEAMGRRRDAELALGVARRQQRFWSRAWLLGPLIAVVQVLVTPIGWVEGALLAGWGALLLGMMAAWWWTRARRAELENLKVVGGRGARTSNAASRKSKRLPSSGVSQVRVEVEVNFDDASGPTPRPPRPRGRKRR